MPESNRLKFLTLLKKLCSELRSGQYHVRRGRVNWSKFPFSRHPLAISVMMPEEDLTTDPTRATISLEFMTKMPDHSQVEINDTILDAMRDDALQLLIRLSRLTGEKNPTVLSVEILPNLEIADADRELQGIEQPFIVEY